jgi:hypothetical protein
MIKELKDILHIEHPSLDLDLNKSQTKLSIKNDAIIVSKVENLFEIKYENFIHYTQYQSEILKIIKDNI